MFKISLYHNFCERSSVRDMNHNNYDYRKNQSYTTDRPATSAIGRGLSPGQEPCIPHALSRSTSEIHRSDLGTGWRTDRHDPYIGQLLGETLRERRNQRAGNASRPGSEANNGLLGRRIGTQSHRERQAEREESERGMAAGFRKRSKLEYLQGFFIRLDAGYRRIRNRPKGKPSPQVHAYKTEKLQELVQQEKDFIMEMKATSAPRDMCHTDGSSEVRMSIFHLKEV